MSQLCQLADVKAYLGITATTTDAVLTTLIGNASAFIESYCNRVFASAAYTETRNGTGSDRMYCMNAPVTSVSAVTVDTVAQVPAPDAASDGYVFDANMIYLRNGYFCKGIQNVTLAYTAGFATIPPDVNQACVELVASKFAKRDRIDQKNMMLAEQTVGFDLSDMPLSVKTALANYKRWPA